MVAADTETIHKAAVDTDGAKAVAEDHLRELRDEVEMLRASWSGQAGMSFERVMAKWNENTTALISAMDGISDQLHAAAHDYTMTDEEERAAMNKFEQEL